MSTPITAIREGTRFTQATATVVITAFLSLILSPSAAAAKDALRDAKSQHEVPNSRLGTPVTSQPSSDSQRETIEVLRRTLQDMNRALTGYRDLILKKRDKDGTLHIAILGTPADVDLTQARKQIAEVKKQFAVQGEEADAAFRRDLEHIGTHGLPDTIRQRHAAALDAYRKERESFNNSLNAIETETNLVTLIRHTEDVLDRTKRYLPQHTAFNPKDLPFGAADPKVRVPKTDVKELSSTVLINHGIIPTTSSDA